MNISKLFPIIFVNSHGSPVGCGPRTVPYNIRFKSRRLRKVSSTAFFGEMTVQNIILDFRASIMMRRLGFIIIGTGIMIRVRGDI